MNAKVMKETSSVSLLLLDHKTGTINKGYNSADCNIYSFSVDNDYSLLLIKFNIYINSTLSFSSLYTSLGNRVTDYGTNDGILLSTSGSGSTIVGSAFAYRRDSYWQYNNVSSSTGGTQSPCDFSSYQVDGDRRWDATVEYDVSIYGF